MDSNWNSVIAVATCVYGGATLLLVVQIWRDRVQREKHFKAEIDAGKLRELQTAFYEAWGYWQAHWMAGGLSRWTRPKLADSLRHSCAWNASCD